MPRLGKFLVKSMGKGGKELGIILGSIQKSTMHQCKFCLPDIWKGKSLNQSMVERKSKGREAGWICCSPAHHVKHKHPTSSTSPPLSSALAEHNSHLISMSPRMETDTSEWEWLANALESKWKLIETQNEEFKIRAMCTTKIEGIRKRVQGLRPDSSML